MSQNASTFRAFKLVADDVYGSGRKLYSITGGTNDCGFVKNVTLMILADDNGQAFASFREALMVEADIDPDDDISIEIDSWLLIGEMLDGEVA